MADLVKTAIQNTRCVGLTMTALPDSTLIAASAGLNTVIQTLTAYEAIVAARISTLNLLLLPALAKKSALENILKSYESTINIFSQGVVSQCPALGATVQVVQGATQPTITVINRTLSIINITSRLQVEYTDYANVIKAQISLLKDVKSQIDNILQIRTSVVLTASINPGSQL